MIFDVLNIYSFVEALMFYVLFSECPYFTSCVDSSERTGQRQSGDSGYCNKETSRFIVRLLQQGSQVSSLARKAF